MTLFGHAKGLNDVAQLDEGLENISGGDDTDQLAFVDDGQGTDFSFHHDGSGIGSFFFGRDGIGLATHDGANFSSGDGQDSAIF